MAKSGEERKRRKDKDEAVENGHGDAPPQAKKSKDKKKKAAKENGHEEAHEASVKAANLGGVTAQDEKSTAHHFDLVKGGQGVLLGCRYDFNLDVKGRDRMHIVNICNFCSTAIVIKESLLFTSEPRQSWCTFKHVCITKTVALTLQIQVESTPCVPAHGLSDVQASNVIVGLLDVDDVGMNGRVLYVHAIMR